MFSTNQILPIDCLTTRNKPPPGPMSCAVRSSSSGNKNMLSNHVRILIKILTGNFIDRFQIGVEGHHFSHNSVLKLNRDVFLSFRERPILHTHQFSSVCHVSCVLFERVDVSFELKGSRLLSTGCKSSFTLRIRGKESDYP